MRNIKISPRKIMDGMKEHFLAVLAVIGIISGIIFTFTRGGAPPLPANQLTLPPSSPFAFNISGIGFIEANTRNINIGSFTSGIVVDVLVKEGDRVKKGQPLFLLDQRTAKADIILKEEQVQSSHSSVEIAKVNVADAEDQVRRAKGMRTGLAITQEEVQKREYALQRMKAELQLQENDLDQAKAQLELAKITLEKLTVTAPTDGIILKVRIRPGEYISEATQGNSSPILMGNNDPLYLRVQIDENDAWRFNGKAQAYAYLKSNKDINFPITFVRLEPYAQPKQRLSGESTELVDTRVVEIVYKIEKASDNIFIGQQMDVFIETDRGP